MKTYFKNLLLRIYLLLIFFCPSIMLAQNSMSVSRGNSQVSGKWVGINADSVHALGYTGKGVIVGVIDDGFDIYNQDFRLPDGRTRILYIWNQMTNTPARYPTTPAYNYGTEWDSSAINASLATIPNSSHGTNCLGIAAGDGSQSLEKGIAPDANIILVIRKTGAGSSDDNVIDAITYIAQKSKSLNLPVSVSYSIGGNFGAHDGSRDIEQTINAQAGNGVLFSLAAGNNRGVNVHVEGTVNQSADYDILLNLTSLAQFYAQFWYRGADSMTISLISPSSTIYGPFGVSASVQTANSGKIIVYHNDFAANGDREIQWIIDSTAIGNWTIRLHGAYIASGMNAGKFDGWKISGSGNWLNHFTDDKNIMTPSTADSALSVAAFDVTNGNISSQSSRGLTRNNKQKPEITAPSNVNSTAGNGGVGTSFSAPHVAGVGALMLQAKPNLSVAEFKQAIQDRARTDAAATATPNKDWGYGKLYALGAIQAILPKSGDSVSVTPNQNYFWNDTSGYAVKLNFASSTISKVKVDIFPNTTPISINGGKAVKRYATFTPIGVGTYNATIRFYYTDAEVTAGGLTEGNLQLYRLNPNTSAWELKGGINNAIDNYVELAGVTQFSSWAIADANDNPLPVELSAFNTQVINQTVKINWTTASELNNAGFEIIRDGLLIASYNSQPSLCGQGTSSSSTAYFYTDAIVESDTGYLYKLRSVDLNGTIHDLRSAAVHVESQPASQKTYGFKLNQNYPNPFNPSTVISYELSSASNVRLSLFDLLGREVAILVNEKQVEGIHDFQFNIANYQLSSGIYFYKLEARTNSSLMSSTRKMIYLK